MNRLMSRLIWAAIAAIGALGLSVIALSRGEPINSIWLVLAAACTYVVGFRFYAKFIAARVMALNDDRATPAERLRNGHDFEPTNKWIVFGHHFAAIAGPGPLVGPTLAAQFGYLPGTLWIIIGAVLGGCVQDFVILFARCGGTGNRSARWRARRSGSVGGFTALLTVLLIMIILLAVVGAGGRERVERKPVGDVHHCRDDADRGVHGVVSALLAAGQGAGSLGDWIRAGDRVRSSADSGSRIPQRSPRCSRSRPWRSR